MSDIKIKAFDGGACEMPKPKPYADREIQIGEDCPHCKVKVQEVLTTSPPRCSNCLGFLAPRPTGFGPAPTAYKLTLNEVES